MALCGYVTLISSCFGIDRGLPVDRYYIEKFLSLYSNDIRGNVLEIGDNTYTRKFGRNRVSKSDVLHVKHGNPNATIVGDLAENAHDLRTNSFDCLIITQTLQLIYDLQAALTTIHRILKPGGSVLVTIPCITSLCDEEWREYWCWGFTKVSAKRLFEDVFSASNVKVEVYGNVLVAVSFLEGLAAQELEIEELDYQDPSYPVLITVRATKSEV